MPTSRNKRQQAGDSVRSQPFPTEWLHYYVVLARSPSFARAAAELNITPQALSKALAAMEDRLGVTLLERSRPLRLLPAGQELLRHARAVLEHLHALDERLASLQQDRREHRLRIGWSSTLVPEAVLPLLSRVRERYPGLCPELHNLEYASLEAWLLQGKLDLCFSSRAEGHPAFAFHEAVASPYLIVGQQSESWDRLGFVAASGGARMGISQEIWPEQAFPRRIVAETNSLEMALALSEYDLGAVCVPAACAEPLLASGRLRHAVPPPFEAVSRVFAFWHAGRPLPGVATLLLEGLGIPAALS